MLRRTSLFVAIVVAISGCGSDGDNVNADVKPVDRVEDVPVRLIVTIKGDVNIAYSGTVLSHFAARRFRAPKDEDERHSQIVGTEPVEPVKHGQGAFLAGASVLPYERDGSYTIPVGSVSDLHAQAQAGGQPRPTSSIKVEWWPTGDTDAEPEVFMRRAKPCEATVQDDGSRGKVVCPEVTNEAQDKRFSFTLEWVAPPSASASSASTAVP